MSPNEWLGLTACCRAAADAGGSGACGGPALAIGAIGQSGTNDLRRNIDSQLSPAEAKQSGGGRRAPSADVSVVES